MQIVPERIETLRNELDKIRTSGRLTSGQAAAMAGSLGFCCGQRFGRLGRSKVKPFSRRQYEPEVRVSLNPQLRWAIDFWLRYLAAGIPREIPTMPQLYDTVITYSDGEGSGGVGVAFFYPARLSRPQVGYMLIPKPIRYLWISLESRLRGTPDYQDIFQLEAIGPY